MNVNQNINKLLYALSIKGQFYKINTFQSYNENKCKYSTSYKVLKRKKVYNYSIDEEEYKYKEDCMCYNKAEVMKYLAEEYQKGSEASGE